MLPSNQNKADLPKSNMNSKVSPPLDTIVHPIQGCSTVDHSFATDQHSISGGIKNSNTLWQPTLEVIRADIWLLLEDFQTLFTEFFGFHLSTHGVG